MRIFWLRKYEETPQIRIIVILVGIEKIRLEKFLGFPRRSARIFPCVFFQCFSSPAPAYRMSASLTSIIESILFVHGEPMGVEKMSAITKRSSKEIVPALAELKKEYEERGFILIEYNGQWQIGSHPDNASYIEELAKSEFSEELSKAALETLAVIAYKGPITRPDIEYIRGVNCSFTLRNLLMRGVIEREENPKDARSYLYTVSMDFLKHLGLTKLEELPRFWEFRKENIEVAKDNDMV